jgi:hypothetical protein
MVININTSIKQVNFFTNLEENFFSISTVKLNPQRRPHLKRSVASEEI